MVGAHKEPESHAGGAEGRRTGGTVVVGGVAVHVGDRG